MEKHNITYVKQRKGHVQKTKCNAYPYSGMRRKSLTVIIRDQML